MRADEFLTEVNSPGELTVDPDLIKRFTDQGWEIDGEGRDQIVMSKPGSRTVLKIVGQGSEVRQDVVRRYVDFFRAHQRNPHFPRVGLDKTFRWKDNTYYVYTQERLYSLPGDEAVMDYLEQAMQKIGRGEYPDLDRLPPGLTAEQVDGLVQAVDQLYGSGQADQYEFDLGNVANIMQRANGQLVIVDPLSDFMSESVLSETIRKISDNKWRLYSRDGSRNLGTFSSLSAAKKHEQEVQAFKHMDENFADGRVKGKSRPGRVKRAGVDCTQSIGKLRKIAKNSTGERSKMAHWCANMKSGRNK